MSAAHGMPPPAVSITSASFSARRATMTTCPPSRTASIAHARPIPADAPTTTTRRPSSRPTGHPPQKDVDVCSGTLRDGRRWGKLAARTAEGARASDRQPHHEAGASRAGGHGRRRAVELAVDGAVDRLHASYAPPRAGELTPHGAPPAPCGR